MSGTKAMFLYSEEEDLAREEGSVRFKKKEGREGPKKRKKEKRRERKKKEEDREDDGRRALSFTRS